jgi:hypothetical protein
MRVYWKCHATLAALVMVSACELRITDNEYVAADGGDPADSAAASCVPFCNKLEACGDISPDAGLDCATHCEAQFVANAEITASGCSCVLNQSCETSDVLASWCPGAPIP